jgi:catechol 2,3-dioxygenase-like lactoylglutathione lyase family enzyme
MDTEWPQDLPIAQVRVARPTDKLTEVVRFYRDGIGLREIGSFEGHDGYSGVMIGLPGHSYHLEFTQHDRGSPCPAPSKDNLLVFYIPDRKAIERIVSRLAAMGYQSVPPENPYWEQKGVTIEDPDGWRVVLMNTGGIEP